MNFYLTVTASEYIPETSHMPLWETVMEIPITPLRAQYVVCELPSWRFFNAHTAVPQNGHCPRWASRISLALARASRTTATSPAAGSPNAEASALRPSLVKPQRCFNRYPAKKLANSQRAAATVHQPAKRQSSGRRSISHWPSRRKFDDIRDNDFPHTINIPEATYTPEQIAQQEMVIY